MVELGRDTARTFRYSAARDSDGERFAFGRNWAAFLRVVNDDRIRTAERSLLEMLELGSLAGLRFLDVGSGSGLFSLAARRQGARVHSFDFDVDAVGCGRELRRRYSPDPTMWTIEQGSVLDEDYIRSLGTFDVVYSWGVLHHTGRMWQALNHVRHPLAPGGKLFIAIYNDTGSQSARWLAIKRTYNRIPAILRSPFAACVIAPSELKRALGATLRGRPMSWVHSWIEPRHRGMSHWRDIIDWVGGYPYEVARPEEIFDFYRARGLVLARLKCGGVGLGCNEFVFQKPLHAES